MEVSAQHHVSLKGSQYPLKRRLLGPRDGTASVGNGTTVIRPVCSLLPILAELPWLVAWMMLFSIVPSNGLFCAIFA